MKTVDFSHFIERYIAGEMGDDERQWFEKELDGNISLRAEVDLRKKTDQVLRGRDVMSLRNKLTAIEKKRREAEIVPKKSVKPALVKYAAAITILALLGSLYLFRERNSGSEDLMGRYYKVYEPPAGQRSGKVAENPDFTIALEFYNTNDFANAALFFSKVVENNPRDMQSVLLNGVSNFEEKRYPEAKKSFVTVIDDNNNLYIEAAKWYLALCYLKTDETGKAEILLKTISEEGGIYARDAKKLLRSLR
jgi:TolA-binding protein